MKKKELELLSEAQVTVIRNAFISDVPKDLKKTLGGDKRILKAINWFIDTIQQIICIKLSDKIVLDKLNKKDKIKKLK